MRLDVALVALSGADKIGTLLRSTEYGDRIRCARYGVHLLDSMQLRSATRRLHPVNPWPVIV